MNRVKAPNQFPAYIALAKYSLKAQLRNRSTFAFGFVFPIVFISVFGLIGSGGAFKAKVGFPTGTTGTPIYQALKNIPSVEVKEDTKPVLEDLLRTGKLDAVVTVTQQANGRFLETSLMTSSANPQNTAATTGLIKGVVDQLNLQLAGVTHPPITLSQSEISGRQFRYIDFALPGQIGFALLSTAVFGTVFGMIFLKKAKVLKRIFATPTRPLTIILGQGTSRLIIALAQATVILAFGVLVFHFTLINGWLTFVQMLLLSAFGLISFLGFGLFIAGMTNDENGSAPIVQLFSLPQFLLSGTFFPIDNLPGWLQPIASNLPLTYFNTAMRKISTETSDFSAILPYMLGLAVWSLIAYLLTAKTFKWE